MHCLRFAPLAAAFLAFALTHCSNAVSPMGDAGDSGVVDALADTTSMDTAGSACTSDAQCGTGQRCVYLAAGCGVTGVCRVETPCTRPAVPYCGCDGTTALDSCEGVPFAWTHMGPCEGIDGGGPPPDASGTVCRTASDCSNGQHCYFATAGCATGATGVCGSDAPCARALGPYCGCDGQTFMEECSGVPGPWAHQGACEGVDAGANGDADPFDSGGGACMGGTCTPGLSCCGSGCKNLHNDPLNCGTCGHQCTGANSMCSGGTCVAPTCAPACGAGEICCDVQRAGPTGPPICVAGVTCPVGCPACL